MKAEARPLYGIMGPTASGKSALAMALCEQIGGEIVSVDSAQVFLGLDVGTAKPTAAEQARVPHHLIDQTPPDTPWSAARFAEEADAVIAALWAEGKTPILCGGTGLWMRALTRGIFKAPEIEPALREAVRAELAARGPVAMHAALSKVDPAAAARIQPTDPQRIGRALEVFRQTGRPISALQAEHGFKERRYNFSGIALDWPRELLRERIAARTRQLYAGGLLEETQAALDQGYAPDCAGLSIIGYRDAVRHLVAGAPLEACIQDTITQTRRYAKRQRNWFNHEPAVRWLPPSVGPEEAWAQLQRCADLRG